MQNPNLNTSPSGESAEAARQEIEAAYAIASEAIRRMEIRPLIELTVPGFTQTLKNGQIIPRDGLESFFTQWKRGVQSVNRYEVGIDDLKVEGNRSVVMTTSSLDATFLDPTGAVHQGTQTAKTQDTWIRTPNGWRMKSTENLDEAVTLDGQPYTSTPA